MAETLKVLAQSAPSGVSLTDAYTVAASTSAVVSSLIACNQATSPAKIRVSVAVAGAADATKQYIYYDALIAAHDTFAASLGFTLATTDVVRVYSDNGYVSFTLFGSEIT